MIKKIFILFIPIMIIIGNCKSKENYDKVLFSIENKNFKISSEKKEKNIDFNDNVDSIIKKYKAINTLSGSTFDLFTIRPYPIEFAKIYGEDEINKDKVLDIIINFDLRKGQKTGQNKLNKYAEEFKDILLKIKYDNYYLEINNKMKIDDVIIQLEKNKMKYLYESDDRLSIEESRINMRFNKESKIIYTVQYFFEKRKKPAEQNFDPNP